MRRIAYTPRLDLAIRAGAAIRPRTKLRPYGMIERKRRVSLTATVDIIDTNTASFPHQLLYTNDGDKIARRAISIRLGEGGLGGAGVGSGGGGSGGIGSGWPR